MYLSNGSKQLDGSHYSQVEFSVGSYDLIVYRALVNFMELNK